jgi:hypothetical protein
MIGDWLGWGSLSITEQLNAMWGAWIGGSIGLLAMVLFSWPRQPRPANKKAKKKPAKKRGRR